MLIIKQIITPQTIADAKQLLIEYGNYMYTELNLVDGKGSFYEKLKKFPGHEYEKPTGAFIVAFSNNTPVGCAGVRKFEGISCELKRMYVRPTHRGQKIGDALCVEVIKLARDLGFTKMLLDTNREMVAAIDLYKKFNFKEIPPYCINVNQNPVYMGLDIV
jgi:ribosomal protein S18 acetylase RimI-like enzyme